MQRRPLGKRTVWYATRKVRQLDILVTSVNSKMVKLSRSGSVGKVGDASPAYSGLGRWWYCGAYLLHVTCVCTMHVTAHWRWESLFQCKERKLNRSHRRSRPNLQFATDQTWASRQALHHLR
jgi:hypothetical protein